MFSDKTRTRKFWTHSSSGFIPPEILDFLFEYDSATRELYRIRENDGRHIIPPRVVRSNYFNIYDSLNTKKRFRVSNLIRIISNGV